MSVCHCTWLSQVLVSVEVPSGRAPLDPLSSLKTWAPPQGAPDWDPLRAVLGAEAPSAGAWSLFRGLAEAAPPEGKAAWDLWGSLTAADSPTVASKYDLLQGVCNEVVVQTDIKPSGLRDVRAPTTESKYDIGTDLKHARPPTGWKGCACYVLPTSPVTGEAFNMLKDLVAALSQTNTSKDVDRDAPWGVVGLGSAKRPDGTTVNVFGVTVNNKQN